MTETPTSQLVPNAASPAAGEGLAQSLDSCEAGLNGSETGFAHAASALVIGGGIAGIQAALDIAEAGFQVHLVERLPSIGGRMSQLDKTFPTLDCSACILTPKMADVPRNPRINLMTGTEVLKVEGKPGAFRVTLQQEPRYVDLNSCTGCGDCATVCPVEMPGDFNAGLDTHKAIYRRFPQAIPAAFAIEKRASPCKSTCPAHIPVQGYVALIGQGKFHEALECVRQAGIPFVGTLGRVCYHPCESNCKRADYDEALSICTLKRFAYDAGLEAVGLEQDRPQPVAVQYAEKVAIVGAGPAGLTAAYELMRRGYRVTIFDALPIAGGMLVAGIPAYRLPREVLKHEIEYICSLGAEVRLNTPVGREGGPSLDDLRRDYAAIFMAVGAHGSSPLGIPGEDAPGVMQAAPFLRKLNLGETCPTAEEIGVGKRVAVIGGGNSAIDAARCALRLGSQVKLLYRRSRAEMPAAPWEVAAAEAEGVELNFLVAPLRVLEGVETLHATSLRLECTRMELGEPDASGRRRPVPVPGSEFIIELDTIIAAIGQTVESEGLGVETKRGNLAADRATLMTAIPGVFAGGDAVTGPASVVEAVGHGIEAAESIHRYLRGLNLTAGRKLAWPKADEIEVKPFHEVRKAARAHVYELPLVERTGNFREVESGFTVEQALAEAQRCLDCAVCSECLQCVTACKRGSIHHDQRPEQIELEVGTVIVATGFDVFDPHFKPEMGYGVYPQVITTLEFERLASASGPTAGKIILNGKTPKKVVFIQCVGSRDLSLGLPNCSRVCCMAVAKQAHLAHDRIPGAEITVFYMDVRAFGKGFEEFYDRVRNEGVRYRRGNPSEIIKRGERVAVRAEDTLLSEQVEVEADLVVLAVGMTPRQGAEELAQAFDGGQGQSRTLQHRLQRGEDGYFLEQHPKLRTVESNLPGVFLAGCCQGPKDIPDTVAHAKAAASAAMILLSGERNRQKGAEHASN